MPKNSKDTTKSSVGKSKKKEKSSVKSNKKDKKRKSSSLSLSSDEETVWKTAKKNNRKESSVWKDASKKESHRSKKDKKSSPKKKETKEERKKRKDIQMWKEVDQIFEKNVPKKSKSPSGTTKTCKNCDSANIVNDVKQGNIVCTDCGTISDFIIDESPEWRQYNNEDGGDSGGTRCGGPISYFLPSSSIGTNIICPNYVKIKKLHNQAAMPYHERSLYMVMTELTNICRDNFIKKNVLDEALILYKRIHDTKHKDGDRKGEYVIHRGGTRKGLKAACLYEGLKKRGKPHSHSEVANMFGYELSHVRIGCRLLGEILDQKQEKGSLFDKEQYFKNSDPEDFIERFCRKYKQGKNYAPEIRQIIINSNKLGIATEHTPPSIAAASILLVSKMDKLDVTRKQVADLFDLADITVQKPFIKMQEYQDILTNDKSVKKACKLLEKQKKKNKDVELDIVVDD